jgi:beta-glucosidase
MLKASTPQARLTSIFFLKAAHTVNLAQGDAFRAIKAIAPEIESRIRLQHVPSGSTTSSPEDAAAAKRFDAFNNVWFLETALRGRYPEAFVHGTPLEPWASRAAMKSE